MRPFPGAGIGRVEDLVDFFFFFLALLMQLAAGKVHGGLGKTQQLLVGRAQGGEGGVRPEQRAALALAPGYFAVKAVFGGHGEVMPGPVVAAVFVGVQHAEKIAQGIFCAVPFHFLGALVPHREVAGRVHQEDGDLADAHHHQPIQLGGLVLRQRRP